MNKFRRKGTRKGKRKKRRKRNTRNKRGGRHCSEKAGETCYTEGCKTVLGNDGLSKNCD